MRLPWVADDVTIHEPVGELKVFGGVNLLCLLLLGGLACLEGGEIDRRVILRGEQSTMP
jgi:hypothetical protein